MKKTLLSLCMGTVSIYASAQLTLSRADISKPGESFDMSVDSNFTLNAGFETGGSNKTWDFTALSAQQDMVTQFLDPSGIPEATSYPDCNLVIQPDNNFTFYNFINVTDSSVVILGSSDSFFNDTTAFRMMILPLTQGVSWLDEMQFSETMEGDGINFDSMKLEMDMSFQSECDASGTIKLPVGDANALRVKTVISGDATVSVKAGGFPMWIPVGTESFQSVSYNFYSQNCGYKIATVAVNDSIPTLAIVEFRKNDLLDVFSPQHTAKFKVFPNPVQDGFIHLESENDLTVTLINVQGQVEKEKITLLSGAGRIDVSSLAPGVYFLKAYDHTTGHTDISKVLVK